MEYALSNIFSYAIKIEKEGYEFYRQMADQIKEPAVQPVFLFLAKEEKLHMEKFEELEKDYKYSINIEENNTQEVFIRSIVEAKIFPEKDATLPNLKDPLKVINYAISREKDSLVFYFSIADKIPQQRKELLQKIIQEEKQHVLKLSLLKKNFH